MIPHPLSVEESETSSKDCNIEKERNKENLQCGEL